MNKNTNPFLIISVLFNILFILSATLFTCYFYNTEKSGQMGDTIGGTLGPIIGALSLFYVYQTFQEQRKTLIEQQNALSEQKTLNFEQRSTTFYVTILDGLNKVIDEFESLSYIHVDNPGPNYREVHYNGKKLLRDYLRFNGENAQSFDQDIPGKDFDFLRDILRVYEHLTFIQNRKVRLRSLLTGTHYSDISNQIEVVMHDYGFHVNTIFENIIYWIDFHGTEGLTQRQIANFNILIDFSFQFQSLAVIFERDNILERIVRPVIPFEWNQEIPLNIDLRNRINMHLSYRN